MKMAGFNLVVFIFVGSQLWSQDGSFSFSEPADSAIVDTLEMWATEYYVHQMESGGNIPFLNDNGDTLGYYGDTCDFCTACLEGTAFVNSNQGRVVLNYSSVSEKPLINCRKCARFKNSKLRVESWGRVRWKISSGYGEGVEGYKLVPYRTIAVDSSTIAYGSIVYIPSAKGTEMVINDSVTITHDGYFFAGDTGGAIKNNHIDVFTGTDDSHPFTFVKSSAKQTFQVYVIQDSMIQEQLLTEHE